MRLLAVGLDSVGLDDLVDHAAAGRLPTLAKFVKAGLTPIVHPSLYRAELPWTTLLTGKDPATTGYWGTVHFDAGTYRVWGAGAFRGEPFFARLGRPVVVMDVPHSVPWPCIEGLQVTAWGAHSAQHPPASWPHGLIAELDSRFGPHPAFEADSEPAWHNPDYCGWLVDALSVGAGRRAQAFRHLLARQPDWGFAMVVFSEMHSIGHLLWHGQDRTHPLHSREVQGQVDGERDHYQRVLEAVDRAVGLILEVLPPDTAVALFSVHGMTTNANDLPSGYLVPELLHRDTFGWARRANPRTRQDSGPLRPPARTPLGTLLQRSLIGPDVLKTSAKPSSLSALTSTLRRRVREIRTRPSSATWARPGRPLVRAECTAQATQEESLAYLGACRYESLWPNSRVFVLPSFSDTHLRVNLEGREGSGRVPYGAYFEELSRVEQLLRELRHPKTALPLEVELFRTRGGDPSTQSGPPADLVARWHTPVDTFDHPRLGRVGPLPYLRTGEHGGFGFAAMTDPSGRPNPMILAFGRGKGTLGPAGLSAWLVSATQEL